MLWLEILVLLAMILLNGYFAMAELAVVSARPARLEAQARRKDSRGARLALALARDPGRLLRHIERRRDGLTLAYLRYDLVVAAEAHGFPLVGRLLDLGIETDAWTLNPGPNLAPAILRALVGSRVRQITTDAPLYFFSSALCRFPRAKRTGNFTHTVSLV